MRSRPAQMSCSTIRLKDVEDAVRALHSGVLCPIDTLRFVLDPTVKPTPSTIATLLSLVAHCSGLARMRVEDYSVQIRNQMHRFPLEALSLTQLRDLDWCAGLNVNFDSASLLLQLLNHTPRLTSLRVSPDLSMLPLRMLAEFPPANQGGGPTYYAVSLHSFECIGVLSVHDVARIITCSATTLVKLSLVVHAPDFAYLVYLLPALPVVTTLLLLPVEGFFDTDLLVEFLSRFERITRLSIGIHDHANPVELRAIADAPTIHIQTLKLYSLERPWRPAEARVLISSLRKLRQLRRLELIAAGFTNAAVALLCQECARRRVAFLMGVLNHPDEYFLP